ncbi:MAG: hypothetical protein ACYC96_08405 [Fimbriimonadaceae bacterium]
MLCPTDTKRLMLAMTTAAIGLASAASHASPRIEWLQTPHHTYVLLPPTLIAEGDVREAKWSSDGAYLMVSSSPRESTLDQVLHAGAPGGSRGFAGGQLFVYDRASGRSRKLWQASNASLSVVNFQWLSHSSTAYAVVEQRDTSMRDSIDTYGVLALDAAGNRFSWIPGMEHLAREPELVRSPTKALAVAVFDASSDSNSQHDQAGNDVAAPSAPPTEVPSGAWIGPGVDTFWTLGPGGAVLHRIHTAASPQIGISWNQEGSQWFLATINRKTKVRTMRQLGDDGQLTVVNATPFAPVAKPTPELWLHSKPMMAKQRKTNRGFSNLWLSSPEATWHPDALVTPNGAMAQLSPAVDAVFYVEGGVAKVRTLEALSADQKRELVSAVRAQAVNDAKQSVLAMLMYSNDMDDMLPGANDLDALGPYLGDQSILDDFVYTPPTNLNQTQIAEPANTQIGYIDGPGGRAIAYADGHVKWINNP